MLLAALVRGVFAIRLEILRRFQAMAPFLVGLVVGGMGHCRRCLGPIIPAAQDDG